MNQTDHHFSKKLRDMEIAPSERANELFRNRLEQASPKKQSPGKYFATAAAVLVALGFLFYLYQNESVMKSETAFVVPKATHESDEPEGVSETSDNEASASETADSMIPDNGLSAAGHQAEDHIPAEKVIPASTKETPARRATGAVSQPVPVYAAKTTHPVNPEQIPAENRRKRSSELQSLNPEISYRYHSTDLTDYAILDAHSALEVQRPEAPSKQAPDRTVPLLAKVVREVKYVANGEKPDFDRAGIKPVATSLAHNQSGLLANESRQIREGIHKFKEIFR